MKLLLATSLLLLSLVAAELVHFHDHAVLKYELKDESQIRFIKLLGLDVWSHDSVPIIGMNDIMVTPAQQQILTANGIHHKEVMIADVEKHLSNERETLASIRALPTAGFFDSYHKLDELTAFYVNITTANPGVSKYIPSIGMSVQGRPIPALLLGNSATAKKRIYFEGGQHAREWVGHATVAYIVSQLLDDPLGQALLKDILFVVVPVVNVDGYVFTWDSNRLWRKNRKLNTGGSYGVDLNRNWNDHWGGEGASKTPSSDTYCGTAPFSEPESLAASKFYLENGPYGGAIDYHSYSQLVLRPTGWTTTPPVTDPEAKLVGDGIRDTIRASGGVQYTSEASWELYFTAGTAQDWYFSEGTSGIKLPLSYTIELRDTGNYGFQLPPAQIIPTGKENWEAFKYFANYILKKA